MQHGSIANASPGSDIRDIEYRLHFGNRQIVNQRYIGFLDGIASTRRLCSRTDGTRCSTKRMKDLIAANLTLRVLALLPSADSMCPRKSITIWRIDLFEIQLGWRHLEPYAGKLQGVHLIC